MSFRVPPSLSRVIMLADIKEVDVRPFEHYPESPLSEEVWTLRLLNGSEWVDAQEEAKKQVQVAYGEKDANRTALNISTFSRSLIKVNGTGLFTPEDIREYNRLSKLPEDNPVDPIQLIQHWIRNTELSVLNRFEEVYLELMQKQQRMIQGFYLCRECRDVFLRSQLPAGSVPLKQQLAEIICGPCNLKLNPVIEDESTTTAENTTETVHDAHHSGGDTASGSNDGGDAENLTDLGGSAGFGIPGKSSAD